MTGLRHGSVDMTTDVTAQIDLCGTEIGIFHRQHDVTINGSTSRTVCVSHNCPACTEYCRYLYMYVQVQVQYSVSTLESLSLFGHCYSRMYIARVCNLE